MSMGFSGMSIGQENSGSGVPRGATYLAAIIAVIILSTLLLAGIVALIFGFMRQYEIYRGGARSSAKISATANPGTAPAMIALEPGARIMSVKTDASHLILQLSTAQGDQVEVLDLATGKLLYRVAARP
jgi:hypothetical protein